MADFDRARTAVDHDDLVVVGKASLTRFATFGTTTVAFGAATGLSTRGCQVWHPGKLGRSLADDADTAFGFGIAG